MKDNNFLEIDHDLHHSLINMEDDLKANYRKMIAADSMFLRVNNIIDYSLLLVIETTHKKSLKVMKNRKTAENRLSPSFSRKMKEIDD